MAVLQQLLLIYYIMRQGNINLDMLSDNKSTAAEALLGNNSGSKSSSQITSKNSAPAALQNKLEVNNENIETRQSTSKQKKRNKEKRRDKNEAQFTTVLKFFNILIGLGVIAFGVSCYKFFNDDTKSLDFVGVILPGYIAFSGLIIVLVECNIGFIIRNMRFLYNFIGRGLFNIYVGVMPLSLIRLESEQNQTFQIIIYIMVSLMCLVGILYIIAKIFCCAKEDNKKKKRRDRSDSQSESD